VAVVRPGVHESASERHSALDLAAGLEGPARPVRAHVDRVDPVVPGTEVDGTPDEQRRRLDHTCPEAPENLARASVQSDERAGGSSVRIRARPRAHQGDVDHAPAQCRRRGDAPPELTPPGDPAAARVDRDHAAAVSSQVEASVADHGRELDEARVGEDRPELAERRPKPQSRGEVGPLRVDSVGWPGKPFGDRRRPRPRLEVRRELDGGRADHVVRLAVEVDEVAADADRAADDDAGEEKQTAPHDETIVTIGGRREKSPGQGRLEPATTPIVSARQRGRRTGSCGALRSAVWS
jgi:hypothetical protein